MNIPTPLTETVRIDLGGGLTLRRGTAADGPALAEFNSRIHSDDGFDQPDDRLAAWTADLASGQHPTFRPSDFTLVEEHATGRVVSTMNLISQTWSYSGCQFPVGRPELVGTLPEYRGRSLVRAQFELIHQMSAARGELLQAITGIPYYYRLFGYEMAMNLGGGRVGHPAYLPKLKDGEQEPYLIRPATEADLPFIAALYERSRARSLVSCNWGLDLWRYELSGKQPRNVNRLDLRIIETPAGRPVGCLGLSPWNWGSMMPLTFYELEAGQSYGMVTPSVVRHLWQAGLAHAAENENGPALAAFGLMLGGEHPAYHVMRAGLPTQRKPYSWFLRVPDLPAFLRCIAPALEARLAASPYAGHTAELTISFYRSGLRLGIEAGRLAQVEPWQPQPQGHSGRAGFPGLTFLHALFGYHDLLELRELFPDVFWDSDETSGLLLALFPRQVSNVYPIS